LLRKLINKNFFRLNQRLSLKIFNRNLLNKHFLTALSKMVKTISMEDMRHLNLFNKVTRVETRFCFDYNNMLIFCVPHSMIHKAVGDEGKNIRRMKEILKKRIRIVSIPRGIRDASRFIESVVNPVTFKNLEVNGDEIIITASRQSKAALIGREKRRLKEMQEIVKGFFEKDLKII